MTMKEIFNTEIGIKALVYSLYKNHTKDVITSMKDIILDLGSENFELFVEEVVRLLGGQEEGRLSADFFHNIAQYLYPDQMQLHTLIHSEEEADAFLNKLMIDYPPYFNNELLSSYIDRDEFLRKCGDDTLLEYLSDEAKDNIGNDYLRNCDDDTLLYYLSEDAKDEIGEDYLRNCDNEVLLREVERRMR